VGVPSKNIGVDEMFLHLGGSRVIPADEIIMILNLRSAGDSKITRELMELLQVEGMLEGAAEGEQKSLAITDNKAYFSPISSLTLKSRLRKKVTL
jgi:hypothetical protein